MTLRLTRLDSLTPIVGANGLPTEQFQRLYQRNLEAIELAVNNIADTVAAIAAAQAAADAANTAAATAQSAATAAGDAATAVTEQTTLSNSYVTGLTITATDAGSDVTIAISAHTRHYPQPDGSEVTVSVNSGSLTGRAYSTSYWIYYDDPSRAGGAVSYQSTTTQATAAQTGDRHFVGAVTTPAAAAGPVTGKNIQPPGTVQP